jgi:hypothetical protein
MICGILLTGVTAIATIASKADDEQPVPIKSLPAAVKKASEKAVPGAKWSKAVKELDEGKTIYTLTGTNAAGVDVETEITSEGTVLEVETTIPLSAVPKVVLSAAKAKFPGFKVTDAASVAENGKIVAYSLEGTLNNEDEELRVSADGKTVDLVDEDDD